jgi:ubiquinol-cytochrome c reductase cytochrome b subunit
MADPSKYPEEKKLGPQFEALMIDEAPHYANRFWYSLGFLAAISFTLLIVTGVVEVFFGADWWLTNPVGVFFRSVHMWATQAFVVFILMHLVVVFCTAGYRGPRRITWILGVVMFLFALIETEMGYALRGDFSNQWRALQGADFFNGTGLGWWINPLNELKIMGTHIAIFPLIILTILVVHYMLVRFLGIATPMKADHPYKVEKANHTTLFLRGGVIALLIVLLGIFLPSPYVKAITLQEVAKNDPKLFARTLVGEFGRLDELVVPGQKADVKEEDLEKQALTTGYMDNIQPYTFDTRKVYVDGPFSHLLAVGKINDDVATIEKLSDDQQKKLVADAADFFGDNKGKIQEKDNLLVTVANELTAFAATGYYDQALKGAAETGDNTYHLRLLADLGVLADQADKLDMTTEKYGMIREEKPGLPGAWWLVPIGVLNHTVLATDENGDRDGALILGILVLILAAVPFIPGVNRLPEILKLYVPFQARPKEAKK